MKSCSSIKAGGKEEEGGGNMNKEVQNDGACLPKQLSHMMEPCFSANG